MPLDRFVLLIVIVLVAAGATIWLGSLIAAAIQLPAIGFAAVLPVTLVAFLAWRVISDRLTNKEDDHYDRIEK